MLHMILFLRIISSMAVKILKKQRIEKIMNNLSFDYSKVYPFSRVYMGNNKANNTIAVIIMNLKTYIFFLILVRFLPLKIRFRKGSIEEQQAKKMMKKYQLLLRP